jgi:hypothetical protein
VLLFVLGVHVCAALQKNIACIDEAVGSGVMKRCFATADAVKEGRQQRLKLNFSSMQRGIT